MTTRTLDGMVDAYLDRLDAALDGIPERRRRQLVSEVGERIDAARLDLPVDSEAGVRAVLASVGSPEEVGAREHAFHPWSSRRSRWRRGAAAVVALSLVAAGSVTVVASTRSGSDGSGAAATVPDVIGRTETVAARMLRAAHLGVGAVERRRDPAAAAGTVVSEHPAVGATAHRGARVTLEISNGP